MMQPSHEQVKRIVGLGQSYASADNNQPFTFGWDGQRLHIYHDDFRARYVMNSTYFVSFLSLGSCLESLDEAASCEGLTIRTTLEHELASVKPWAHVQFVPCEDERGDARSRLLNRRTDRRNYCGGSIDDPVFDEIERLVPHHPSVRIEFREPTADLVEFISHLEALLWTYEPHQQGITEWFRLSRKEAEETRDGMFFGLPLAPVLRLSRAKFAYQRWLNRIGFLAEMRRRTRRALQTSAALGCLILEEPTMDQMVAVGRLGIQSWLTLNESHYGFHPFTGITSLILIDWVNALPSDMPEELRAATKRGDSLLRASFGLRDSELPAWFFRTGRAKAARLEHPNLRLPTEQVLSITE